MDKEGFIKAKRQEISRLKGILEDMGDRFCRSKPPESLMISIQMRVVAQQIRRVIAEPEKTSKGSLGKTVSINLNQE